MARVEYVDADTAAPEAAETLRGLPAAHVFGMVAQTGAAFRPWTRLGLALLTELELAPSLRELVILQVGRLAPQRYEWDQHVPIALASGVRQEQVDALERGAVDAASFGPVELAVLGFVADMVRDGEVTDADYATLAGHLDDRRIVEVALVAAHYLGLARMMTALRIDPDEPIGVGALGARTT